MRSIRQIYGPQPATRMTPIAAACRWYCLQLRPDFKAEMERALGL